MLLPLVLLGACDIDFDFELELGGGPVVGTQGNVTFAMIDGCPGYDELFGCRAQMPHFAVGSQARFLLGSTTGDADDERRVARQRARTTDPDVAVVRRDADGLLVLDSIAPGVTTIQLYEDGLGAELLGNDEPLDEVLVEIEDVRQVFAKPETLDPPLHILGSRFPVGLVVHGLYDTPMYARGAVGTAAEGAIVLEENTSGFFTGSDQIAVRAVRPGTGSVTVWTDTSSRNTTDRATFHIVRRDDITELSIVEMAPSPSANKVTLAAVAKMGGKRVHGGPVCDWRIASGGGPGAAISARVGDDFSTSWITLYDSAIVFGAGPTVVECRVSDRLVATHTIQLAP